MGPLENHIKVHIPLLILSGILIGYIMIILFSAEKMTQFIRILIHPESRTLQTHGSNIL